VKTELALVVTDEIVRIKDCQAGKLVFHARLGRASANLERPDMASYAAVQMIVQGIENEWQIARMLIDSMAQVEGVMLKRAVRDTLGNVTEAYYVLLRFSDIGRIKSLQKVACVTRPPTNDYYCMNDPEDMRGIEAVWELDDVQSALNRCREY
jgi:hypothetical protein